MIMLCRLTQIRNQYGVTKVIFYNINQGTALSKQNNFKEAIKCYNEALRINQKYDDAWF